MQGRWRQRKPRPKTTADCGEHKAYATLHDAMGASKWHPTTACTRCLSGKVWHVWQHGSHFHVGHKSVYGMVAFA